MMAHCKTLACGMSEVGLALFSCGNSVAKVNLAHKVRRASQVRKDRRALKVLQVTRVMRPPSNLVPSKATDL
jgi:hypothetical protein